MADTEGNIKIDPQDLKGEYKVSNNSHKTKDTLQRCVNYIEKQEDSLDKFDLLKELKRLGFLVISD